MRSCGSALGYTGSRRVHFALAGVLFHIGEFGHVAALVKGGVAAKDYVIVGGLSVLLILLALLVQPVNVVAKVVVKVVVKVAAEVGPAHLVRVCLCVCVCVCVCVRVKTMFSGVAAVVEYTARVTFCFLCFRARAPLGHSASTNYIYSLDMRVTRHNSA